MTTLEELMAEFPHGSRWQRARGGESFAVVGWTPNEDYEVVVRWEESLELDRYSVDSLRDRTATNSWERIPDTAPNPITEPVTLQAYAGPVWSSTPSGALLGHVLAITLHPDGTYTWEGGPQ